MTEKSKSELRNEKYAIFRSSISSFFNRITDSSGAGLQQIDNMVYRVIKRLARLQRERDAAEMRALRAQNLDVENMMFDTAFPEHIDKIEYVDVPNGAFKLIVTTIDISLPVSIPSIGSEVQVPIGRFEITFSMNVSSTTEESIGISIKNLDHTHTTVAHPHVNGGIPCWGELYEVVYQKRNTLAICELIDITVQFLLSYNPNSAYAQALLGWYHRMPEDTRICPRCIKPIKGKMVGSREIKCACTRQQLAGDYPTIVLPPVQETVRQTGQAVEATQTTQTAREATIPI